MKKQPVTAYIVPKSCFNGDGQTEAFLCRSDRKHASGCPMGRGKTQEAAIADLERRVNTCQEVQIEVTETTSDSWA